MTGHDTPRHIKINEREHVEKPLFECITRKVRVGLLLTEPQEAGS